LKEEEEEEEERREEDSWDGWMDGSWRLDWRPLLRLVLF